MMNVVYYSSDFFSEMCGVAIESLCENNQQTNDINVYIIEDQISDVNKSRLRQIIDRFQRNLIFIKMPTQKEVYPDVKINLGRTYTRMILGELLPKEVDRVLSLDSDTLVMDSIDEMYNIDLEDKCVGGVYDCLGKAMQFKVLHKDEKLKYSNAGVFLINLKKWREQKIGEKLLDTVINATENKKSLYFLEQDFMNLVLENNLKLLNPRYNLLTSIYIFSYKDLIRMKKPVSYYNEAEVNEAKQKPALLHATTCFYVRKRMWVEGSDHPYTSFYIDYRNRTPWKLLPQIKDSRKFSKRIYAAAWHTIPRFLAVPIASFTINYVRPWYAKISGKLSIQTIANQSST
ncbi:MAG: glycosyltransferase family 8 protein [Paludibacter sp.]